MKRQHLLPLLLLFAATSCAGTRQTGNTYTSHAEAFHILGFTIPSDDHQRAVEALPEDATVQTMRSSPSDWTSVLGVLTNLLGISSTEITYVRPEGTSDEQ